jgi:hypothetical protein
LLSKWLPEDQSHPLPPTLGFLLAPRGYPPPMIAAFGIRDEPEPGIMFLPNASIRGMHLTRLAPDGSDRDRGERAKIIIGNWPATHCGGAHG